MTVSVQDTLFRHVGNGVTTSFAYNCQVLQPNDLYVYVDGAEVTSGITKNGIGNLTGGTVVFSVAPANGAAIILEREVALERTTDYQQNGDFLARVVNPDFNRIWMAIQQLFTSVTRSIRFPKEDVDPVTELPPAADRANKLLSFDSLGNPVVIAPDSQSATALSINLAAFSGSSLIGFIQQYAGSAYRSVQSKLRDTVSVTDFYANGVSGALVDPTGVLDSTLGIQAAINTGRAVKVPSGTYKITAPLSLTSARFYGEGPARSRIDASACHAFTIVATAGLSRPACIVSGIGIGSTALNCDGKYAFYVPGVASGAAVVYNSGFTVRDVEIGAIGRMGGGFYLKDLFRCNIENVGMSDVSDMLHIVGSVVQLKVRNATSNNSGAAAVLSRHGITTEAATYSGATVMVPENCRFIDCSYIRGHRGIQHTAGLIIEFENFDCEAEYFGAFLNAACRVQGGIFAPSGDGTKADWRGIYRGSNAADLGGAVVVDGVDVNMLVMTGFPASSIGIDMGDGVSPVNGMVLTNYKVRGVVGSLSIAVRGRNLNDATIEDGMVISNVATGNSVDLTGTGIWFNRNRIQYGPVVVNDNGSSTAQGSVCNNQLGTLTFTPTQPNNWEVYGNLSGETSLWHGVRSLGGVLMVKTTSLTSGVNVAQMGAGAAAFYEIDALGFAGANAAATALKIGSQTTLRSISATGTINASGADYAEYEYNNGLTIPKGAIVGFKADGTLTMSYSEAVRFGVKSTAPSYVGGDTWGGVDAIGERPSDPYLLPEFEAKLELARSRVDRIAYSGKVPVNLLDAVPGGYVMAVAGTDGEIAGAFVEAPDFSQYKLAVGRVNRILDDGRAEIAVIVH